MTSLSLHPEVLDALHPKATTPAEAATVRSMVAAHATSTHDELELLQMLGLAS